LSRSFIFPNGYNADYELIIDPNLIFSTLTGSIGEEHHLVERALLLFPAYQIKWCCIMLNDFIRSDQTRREFALGDHATEERKRTQLAKARRALQDALQVRSCHS
jgi:hypothetical protein